MKKLLKPLVLFAVSLLVLKVSAQSAENYYWVSLKDKQGTAYSLDHPEEFLSERAIARRSKQGIAIDESDLPVSETYTDSLVRLGASIFHVSKWLNGVTINSSSEIAQQISNLGFVSDVQLTKPGLVSKSTKQKWVEELAKAEIDTSVYGASVYQVGQLNGQYLHNQNYKGEGIQIAVLDAGFLNADQYDAFAALRNDGRLLGTRDFVSPGNNVFQENYHGMSVLSTMAARVDGQLIGTAPEASYYLFRTEDTSTEYLVEEDNWIAAAELADSLGVDVINSSLGYYEFDDASMNHTYDDMDGHTTRISRAANMAVDKGILVVTSAGNEAVKPWHYIIAPSDGDNVIGVAAVNKFGVRASFSSVGPASDDDVKPNVAAMGSATALVLSDGSVGALSGTSFASPVLAGMAACLREANRDATVLQIKNAIEQSASQYSSPDAYSGYGIPDFGKADSLLKVWQKETEADWVVYPNPFVSKIYLRKAGTFTQQTIEIRLVSLNGMTLYSQKLAESNPVILSNLANLPRGMYLLQIRTENGLFTTKVVKASR